MTTARQSPEPADTAEEPYECADDPVHTWFGQSHANFLVWHRTYMQSMPEEWQRRFVELAEELDAAYPDGTGVDYEVTTVRRKYVSELTAAEMRQLGVTTSDEDEGGGPAGREPEEYYLKDGQAVPGVHEVGIPVPDPVPHYKRAYVPPDEAGIAACRAARSLAADSGHPASDR